MLDQAEKQLGKGWQLMRGGTPGCPDIPDWLADNLPEGARVGVDPYLHTVSPALYSLQILNMVLVGNKMCSVAILFYM